MYVYMYIHKHRYIYTVDRNIHIYTHIYVRIYIYIYTHTYIHTYIDAYIYTHITHRYIQYILYIFRFHYLDALERAKMKRIYLCKNQSVVVICILLFAHYATHWLSNAVFR